MNSPSTTTANEEVSQAHPSQSLAALNQARTALLLQDQERDRRVAERKRAPIDLPFLLSHSVPDAPRGGEWDSPSSSSSFPSTRHGGSGDKSGGGQAMLTTKNWPEIAVLSRRRRQEEEEGGGATQPQLQLPHHPLAHHTHTPHTVLIKRKAPTSPAFLRFQQEADARLAKASTREKLLRLGGGGGGEGGGGGWR